jgi:hypothetical protein
MTTARWLVLPALLAAGVSSAWTDGLPTADPAPAEDKPSCVEFWGEVLYRNFGYDHVVHLRGRCDVPASCRVWTDVNPQAVDVIVPVRERVEVLTFRGSPAREFTPYVECRLRR